MLSHQLSWKGSKIISQNCLQELSTKAFDNNDYEKTQIKFYLNTSICKTIYTLYCAFIMEINTCIVAVPRGHENHIKSHCFQFKFLMTVITTLHISPSKILIVDFWGFPATAREWFWMGQGYLGFKEEILCDYLHDFIIYKIDFYDPMELLIHWCVPVSHHLEGLE